MNLEDDGWYWVQFHLPADGELSALITKQTYDDYLHDGFEMLVDKGTVGKNTFYGNFCCGETIPERYVYLPTDDSNEGVTQLVYFAKDYILVIDIPAEIMTPQNGTTQANATKYSVAEDK